MSCIFTAFKNVPSGNRLPIATSMLELSGTTQGEVFACFVYMLMFVL